MARRPPLANATKNECAHTLQVFGKAEMDPLERKDPDAPKLTTVSRIEQHLTPNSFHGMLEASGVSDELTCGDRHKKGASWRTLAPLTLSQHQRMSDTTRDVEGQSAEMRHGYEKEVRC